MGEKRGMQMLANEAELKQLMVGGLGGDERSYRMLLEELSRYLRGYFRVKLTRAGYGPAEAEDLLQEVLMAIHTRRHTYDTAELFTPWMHAIARYKLIDYLRRAKGRHAAVDIDDAEDIAAADTHAAAESSHDLQRLLSQIPSKMRQAIQSVKIDGLSVAEAAKRDGMSESAVKINIHRGLKALAALVARERPT
jgi:RNA polymerase sigma-70 factor (ECF subfamily)